MNKLMKKEKLFAFAVGMGETLDSAFRQSGLEAKPETLCRLLETPEVVREIARWQTFAAKRSCRQAARRGLERIAFGGIGDAVKLAFYEELPSPEELSAMDLSCVSEIKRLKGGGCEIKLADRLKALELLASFPEKETAAEAGSFLRALEQSAKELPPELFDRMEECNG